MELFSSSCGVFPAELVDQSLRFGRLLHDALLVVLADAATHLVVVHVGPVFPFAPFARHQSCVVDAEDACRETTILTICINT